MEFVKGDTNHSVPEYAAAQSSRTRSADGVPSKCDLIHVDAGVLEDGKNVGRVVVSAVLYVTLCCRAYP